MQNSKRYSGHDMYVTCIGNFDGVHLGHRRIMKRTVELAERLGVRSSAISIIYPWAYYFPNFPGIIYPVSQRIELILSTGIHKVITANMAEIKHLEPREFVTGLIEQGVNGIVVGRDFTFGNGAKGNTALLEEMASEMGFFVDTVPDCMLDGRRISSSWIREALAKGEIRQANALLGKRYSIRGRVYRDQQLGSKMGFPTANITRGEERLVTPKSGVYIVKSNIEGKELFGLLNVGFRPTVQVTEEVKYEVYYFDFYGDLYDKNIEIEFLEFIRPELKFDGLQLLIEQIKHDEKIARRWLELHSEEL